ncbi:hypothetical protein [Sphingomonas sp. 1P08PE]|uniref:hypothetical protein n=1 Tax=Sphingomonas sp. 1P08PE TaxID=554122 RepID=UPI0039A0EC21
MAIDLKSSLEWTRADAEQRKVLDDLQGNILDGHGRKATRNIFLRFDDAERGRAFVRDMAPLITSAWRQLDDARAFRATGKAAGAFFGLMLSAAGYAALGVAAKKPTDGGAFDQGMLARRALLNDPPPADLEASYRDPLHAMILIGGAPDSATSWKSREVDAAVLQVTDLAAGRATIVVTETGRAIFRSAGKDESGIRKIEGIEHFGYVDGRSQPLLLKELVRREADESDGISVWNPEFPIGQVLVADPARLPPPGRRHSAAISCFASWSRMSLPSSNGSSATLPARRGSANSPVRCWSAVSRTALRSFFSATPAGTIR